MSERDDKYQYQDKELEAIAGRLYNWKFKTAMRLAAKRMADQPNEEFFKAGEVFPDMITAYAKTFGDCGWFEGNMGDIVGFGVAALEVSLRNYDRERKKSHGE